jgi:hypothetical protein
MTLLLSLILVLGQSLGADDEPLRPAVPPTRLGTELLVFEPLVAEATTLRVTPFGIGTAVVRVRLDRVLSEGGPADGTELVVLAYDGHFSPLGRDLVHLLPYRRGGRWRVLERVDGRDRDYHAKVAVTAASLQLAAMDDADHRDTTTLTWLTDLLYSPDRWTREYALGELRFVAVTRAPLFTPAVLMRLEALASTTPDPDLRRGVELVTSIARKDDPPVPSRDPPEPSTP